MKRLILCLLLNQHDPRCGKAFDPDEGVTFPVCCRCGRVL